MRKLGVQLAVRLKNRFSQIGIALLIIGCIGHLFPLKTEPAALPKARSVVSPKAEPSVLSSPSQTPTKTAQGKKKCHRGRDFYGELQSFCNHGNKKNDSPCVNDDGICCAKCGGAEDNDCRILEVLFSAHKFLLGKKSVQGYTPDPRDSLLEPKSEFYRLVPCMQAQGYLNLYACTGEKSFLDEACDRLDFVAAHLGDATSGTYYDGQLGWAFLDAYNFTCSKEYLDIGLSLAGRGRPDEGGFLNWGMLGALNLLRAYEISASTAYLDTARTIVALTLPFQNTDGSFPHQAVTGQRNLPYTSWLSYELIRYCEDDRNVSGLTKAIDRTGFLLARQLNPDGSPRYEWDSLVVVRVPDPICVLCATLPSEECADYCTRLCPNDPETRPCLCIKQPIKDCPYIDSLANVTYYDEEARDYDVRGWTSELPSTAFVLDRTGRLEAKWKVLEFLFDLQNSDGSFPDKWGFLPKPNERMWKFASDTHSVIRTSCVFFYLSSLLRQPGAIDPGLQTIADAEDVPAAVTTKRTAPMGSKETELDTRLSMAVSACPNPLLGSAVISYSADTGFPCRVSVVDICGRTVKKLADEVHGEGSATWDGCDDSGKRVAPGVYFVLVASEVRTVSTKIILLRRNW